MKKAFSFLTALALMLTLLPALTPRANAVASAPTYTDTLTDLIAPQISAYAKSIAQPDSARSALINMGAHATLGGGETLYVNENNALVATIFNSNLFRDACSVSVAKAITTAQNLGLDTVYVKFSPRWYTSMPRYSGLCHTNEDLQSSTDAYEYRLASINPNSNLWTGTMNENDEAMILIGGTVPMNAEVSLVSVQDGIATYDVDLWMFDTFNFNASYQSSKESGFSTGNADLMTFIGSYLAKKEILDDFRWEGTASFRVETPYNCKETSGSYHWDNFGIHGNGLVSAAGNGFVENAATLQTYVNANGSSIHYYALEDTVSLQHDQPWVVEYTIKGAGSFCLSPLDKSAARIPSILQRGKLQTALLRTDYFFTAKEDGESIDYDSYGEVTATTHLYAASTSALYKHHSGNVYTYRLENVIAEDGSNMIYLSIHNDSKGRMEAEQIPLTDHYAKFSKNGSYELQDTGNDWVSGQDILINYIGSQTAGLPNAVLSLSIWEYGQEDAEDPRDEEETVPEEDGEDEAIEEDDETEEDEVILPPLPEIPDDSGPADLPEIPSEDKTPAVDATEQISAIVHSAYEVAKDVVNLAEKIFSFFR